MQAHVFVVPSKRPWKRHPGLEDPSRSVILGLQSASEWRVDSTVELKFLELVKPLDDDMQVQCLPVHKSREPRWTYRKVPKVTSLRDFSRIPVWCRKPQPFVYHLCAEDLTKGALIPTLSEAERELLLKEGVLSPESSVRGRVCVMCPVRIGSLKLIPYCSRNNWTRACCSLSLGCCRVTECRIDIATVEWPCA